jgi:DNA-binding transcriptional regulator GbsR (MarR family)
MPAPRQSSASEQVLAGRNRTSARPKCEIRFEREVVRFFVGTADVLGVPKSVAAIYGVIFAAPGPLSFADIERRLKISKGSISQGLRVLRQFGALKVINGERREFFFPDMEMRKLISRLLTERLGPQLTSSRDELDKLAESVPFLDRSEFATMRNRLRQLQSWQRKASKLLPLIRVILGAGNPPWTRRTSFVQTDLIREEL